jgi:hypothetical protein
LGYYRRLAAANRFFNWRELASAAGVSPSKTGLLGRPDYVAQELGLDSRWTHQLARREESSRAMHRFSRNACDAVCSLCLRDSPYLRAHWGHGFSTACTLHKQLLIDRCHRCGSTLSSQRPSIEKCDCGQDLRVAVPSVASPGQLWLSSLIAGPTVGGLRIEPRVGPVDPRALAHVVRVLCAFHDPAAPPPRRNAAMPATVTEATEFLRPLDDLLADWPLGFHAHVTARIKVSDPNARTLNSALGAWYRQLKKHSADHPELPFLGAVLQVAAKDFRGVIGLDGAGDLAMESRSFVLLKQAVKELGVKRELLIEGLQEGLLVGRTRKLGTRSLVHEILRSEVARTQAIRKGWTDEATACQMLGVSAAVLRNLVESDAVHSAPTWKSDIFKGGPLELASVTQLEARLLGFHDAVAVAGEVVELRQLTSRRHGDKRALLDVFQAISSGALHHVGDKGVLPVGKLKYRLVDVRKYFGTPVLESGLSLHQLTTMTGWKYESVIHWIQSGFLEAESIQLRGQPCRVVLPAQLLNFTRKYIPLADLAKLHGTRSSVMAKRLVGTKSVGAKLLPNGTHRGGLYFLADVTRHAFDRTTGLQGG